VARSAEHRVSVQGEEDIVRARSLARDLAKSLGFGLVDQSRIATAVSELTRNVVRYATGGRGEAVIRALPPPPARLPKGGGSGIEIVVADAGPGIADVALAMREGFTSGTGMGMGLPGTRRLMDELHIDSAPGRGTTVTVRKWRR
jgi:serine/threonine-protein kinase RsbT